MSRTRLMALSAVLLAVLSIASGASACGGLFCQNVPVDQQAERIIFTVDANNIISAYIQINYTGAAPDFSWVVPVPSVPELDVADIATFDELSSLTAPVFFSPLMPDCAIVAMPMMSAVGASDSSVQEVDVLASGTAGPYQYDVVTSPDPQALITWLNDNNYRITPEMEPLVAVYTDEGMNFLAMKLQPKQGVQDIQPIVMTYSARQPMIPLRLTAVAANPNMSILTWVFADSQAVPLNYARPTIKDSDIRSDFTAFGGTNYLSLVDQTVDLYEGRAFITEYAQPTSALNNLEPSDPLLRDLIRNYDYVTRFFGRISPEEMTVDPVFSFNSSFPDVSNIRDLSGMSAKVFYNCPGAELPIDLQFDLNVVPPGFE